MNHTITPGTMFMWVAGSCCMSWPPDGERNITDALVTYEPKENTFLLVVSKVDHHGTIVLCSNGLWWCPIDSITKVEI